jgi:hypothetical protein
MQRCIVWIRGHRICKTSAQKRQKKYIPYLIETSKNHAFSFSQNNWVRTETNRNKSCFGCVSVCFVKPKNKKFRFVSVCCGVSTLLYIETTETNSVSKQTETTLNFLKNTKYALYQTVTVDLLFVSVQLKHRNSLFRYRTETTEQTCDFVRDGRATTPAFSVPHRLP